MTRVLSVLLCLYLIALHTSIAAMEIVSWLLVATVLVHKISRRERPRFTLLWPCVGLVAVVGLSLLTCDAIKPFWFQFGFMRWVILLWAISEAFRATWSPGFERNLVRLWGVLVAVTAAYAVFQFFFGIDLFRTRSHVDWQGTFHRATGFFSGSLTFAYVFGILALAINRPVGVYFGRRTQMALSLATAAGLVASYSRGAWMGAALSLLTYLILARPRLVPYFVVAAGTAVAGLAQISQKFSDLVHLRFEHSASVRVHLWRAYVEMFKDHPWLGSGLLQTDRLLQTYYARLGIEEEFTSHAHNVWLQWAAGAGIFSLALYLFICGYFLRAAWRLRGKSPWGWALLLAQVYWHVGGMTEANFFDGEVNHAIVFTWALLLVL